LAINGVRPNVSFFDYSSVTPCILGSVATFKKII